MFEKRLSTKLKLCGATNMQKKKQNIKQEVYYI